MKAARRSGPPRFRGACRIPLAHRELAERLAQLHQPAVVTAWLADHVHAAPFHALYLARRQTIEGGGEPRGADRRAAVERRCRNAAGCCHARRWPASWRRAAEVEAEQRAGEAHTARAGRQADIAGAAERGG